MKISTPLNLKKNQHAGIAVSCITTYLRACRSLSFTWDGCINDFLSNEPRLVAVIIAEGGLSNWSGLWENSRLISSISVRECIWQRPTVRSTLGGKGVRNGYRVRNGLRFTHITESSQCDITCFYGQYCKSDAIQPDEFLDLHRPPAQDLKLQHPFHLTNESNFMFQ